MSPGSRQGLRSRSLFWTFAGAFLAVVALAAVVQAWVLSSLGARLAQERAAAACAPAMARASRDLARSANERRFDVKRLLHDNSAPDNSYFLIYERADGAIFLPWPAERDVRHRLARWLRTGADQHQLDATYDEAFRLSRDSGGRRPRGAHGPPRPRPRSDPPPHRRPSQGTDGPPRESRQRGEPPRTPEEGLRPPRPGEEPPAGRIMKRSDLPSTGHLRIVDRRQVMPASQQSDPLGDSTPNPAPGPNVEPKTLQSLGRLTAVHPVRRGGVWDVGETPILFLLPLALVLAAAAGLLLVKQLTRRLRGLEHLASRIAVGDLSARVVDPGNDEIGRLGSELNRMAAAVEHAQLLVDRANAERRRLLADISHELATPLTSIRGYAETLLDDEVPTSAEEHNLYLSNVLDEARRMELLLGDLFELTRLESGIGQLEPERLDWAALCHHTAERFRPRFHHAGLDLDVVADDRPVWINADGRRMEQVLENLLTNALRYVPQGGRVTLAVDEDDTLATLEVADDGPGFPAEDLSRVFDRFYRSDATSSIPGSGLGLAIVKEIVERHGGSVHASNRPPAGAALTVAVPILPAPGSPGRSLPTDRQRS